MQLNVTERGDRAGSYPQPAALWTNFDAFGTNVFRCRVMGFGTKHLGHLKIAPPLNGSEVEWLSAFVEIDRRHYTAEYEVAVNPRAFAHDESRARESSSRTAGDDPFTSLVPSDGTPYPHLDWRPTTDGSRLMWTGAMKSRMAEESLQYLIDHFLRPGAYARLDRRPDFEHFTFDHIVSGIVAAERDDTLELFLIRCENNIIRRKTLVPPEHDMWELDG